MKATLIKQLNEILSKLCLDEFNEFYNTDDQYIMTFNSDKFYIDSFESSYLVLRRSDYGTINVNYNDLDENSLQYIIEKIKDIEVESITSEWKIFIKNYALKLINKLSNIDMPNLDDFNDIRIQSDFGNVLVTSINKLYITVEDDESHSMTFYYKNLRKSSIKVIDKFITKYIKNKE